MQKSFTELESTSFTYRQLKLRQMWKMNKNNSKTHFFLIPIGVFLSQEREETDFLRKGEKISSGHSNSK